MSTSRGIDYSKWDHIDSSDSESDDDKGQTTPRVTRLDEPGSVTWTPDGSVTLQPNSGSKITAPTGNPKKPISSKKIEFVKSNSDNSLVSDSSFSLSTKKFDELIRNGGTFRDSITDYPIYWSQTRSEVIISIPFDSNQYPSRAISVEILPFEKKGTLSNPILPYSNRYSAISGDTNVDKGELCVRASKSGTSTNEQKMLFLGRLPHFIHGTEEDEDDDEDEKQAHRKVEWEIINDFNLRYGNSDLLLNTIPGITLTETNKNIYDVKLVQITLRKAVPMYGMCIWWSQPLLHCPSIDVTSISDRNKTMRTDSQSLQSNAKSLQSAWKEAHEMFRGKINEQKMEDNRKTI